MYHILVSIHDVRVVCELSIIHAAHVSDNSDTIPRMVETTQTVQTCTPSWQHYSLRIRCLGASQQHSAHYHSTVSALETSHIIVHRSVTLHLHSLIPHQTRLVAMASLLHVHSGYTAQGIR